MDKEFALPSVKENSQTVGLNSALFSLKLKCDEYLRHIPVAVVRV